MPVESWFANPRVAALLPIFAKFSETDLVDRGRALICREFHIPLDDYQQLTADDGYNDAYNNLLQIRRRLDYLVRSRSAPDATQVTAAVTVLRYFRQYGKFDDMKACSAMIRGGLYGGWTAEQQTLFDAGERALARLDYFLSYTNQGAAFTNARFKDALLGDIKKLARTSTVNAVVCEIDDRFYKNYLYGFFDRKSIQLSDDIRGEIAKGIVDAIVFVQILEEATLERRPPGVKNWCYIEFEGYRTRVNPQRFVFLLVAVPPLPNPPAAAIRPPELLPDYNAWFEEMTARSLTVLETRAAELHNQLRDIAGTIVRLRNEAFNSVTDESFWGQLLSWK
jgi:hypothetical protein